MNSKLNIAIIGIKGAWSSEILKTELENNGATAQIVQIADMAFDVQQNKVFVEGLDLEQFDAVIIKKLGEYAPKIIDWLSILSNLEDKGLRFFSSPKKLIKMISRIGCTNGLAAHQIPMPPTCITQNTQEALSFIKAHNGAIFKPNFSTKARGMEILKPSTEISHLEQLLNKYGTLYLQELMQLPGKDFGVVFMANEYIGTYARVGNKDSWNTTTQDGGHYESFEPNETILNIARKAQQVFNLDFCCVDIAETPSGPIVFEISAFGGFSGMYKGAGINSAALLSKYVLQNLND